MAQATKSKQKTKNAATSNTTKRTSSSKGETPAHQRDARVIVVDTAYAFAGLGNDAVRVARTLPERAKTLPERAKELRDIDGRRADVEKRVRELRDRIEDTFDTKATEGRTIVDDLLQRPQVKSVVDQAKTARSQVKAAVTSIRKTATQTVSAGVTAGRKQADTAKSQAKAATTSIRKTAEVAVEAGKDLINNDGDSENTDS